MIKTTIILRGIRGMFLGKGRSGFFAILGFVAICLPGLVLKASTDLAPCDLLVDSAGKRLFVLEEDACRLSCVSLDGSNRAEHLPLDVVPTRMCWFPGQKKIALVAGSSNGTLMVVSLGKGFPPTMRIEKRVPVGHTPSDVAVGPNNQGKQTIYVCNRFDGSVSVIDYASGKVEKTWPVGREPYAMKVVPSGKDLVVAAHLPEHIADEFYIMSVVRVIDTQTGKSEAIELINGASGCKDVALSPDGKYAFVTGTHGKFQTVTSQVVGGWIVENVFSVIDVKTRQLVDTFFLDDTLLGAANPWGITCSEDGKFLAVSASGTDEIIFLPYDRVLKLIEERPGWNRPGAGAYTYTYHGKGKIKFPMRVRVQTGAKGIRRVVMKNDTVYATSYFEDAVAVLRMRLNPPFENHPGSYVKKERPPLALDPQADHDEKATYPRIVKLENAVPLKGIEIDRSLIRLGPKPQWSEARRGEVLFHDATICMENWLSCATCHPDARVDGLNWDLINDGLGNPKNTKSMLLSHETPPSMISGVRKTAEEAVRAGVTHLLFNEIPENDCAAMDEYLKGLTPVSSPHLTDGKLSPSAERGKFLFESSRVDCASCHPAPLFTDLSFHNVKSQDFYDNISRFDTPSLIEVWRTAPYMNTGHYKTVKELLIKGKHGNTDGRLNRLTARELDDLVEYVLSL
ncbi:MAG: hypothetical protein PHQ75_01095 [Thermoguttaceae bacterium]|nr:hypothetical protein [Thermoguttaceae bacterium]